MQMYSYKDYSKKRINALKQKSGLTVGLALPVLNEEKTLRKTLEIIRKHQTILDQVVIVDSGSIDHSVQICHEMGFKVVKDKTLSKLTGVNFQRGKGWNMWGSLFHLKTDVVVWVDSDIDNFHSGFFLGLIGPLLENNKLKFIKGFYQRPKGDARITEIMARPFINQFFPRISNVIQPLSGEYGGRRDFLEKINFYSGYSVEMAVLIQAFYNLNSSQYTQVHLGKRIHKLQDVPALGRMSASIMATMFEFADEYGLIRNRTRLSSLLKQFSTVHGRIRAKQFHIRDKKLPPAKTISGYEPTRR